MGEVSKGKVGQIHQFHLLFSYTRSCTLLLEVAHLWFLSCCVFSEPTEFLYSWEQYLTFEDTFLWAFLRSVQRKSSSWNCH